MFVCLFVLFFVVFVCVFSVFFLFLFYNLLHVCFIGLVLATDLVSSISQLTPVASIPLSRVNDYLTTVTGISLNYDQPVYKSSPDPNRRTPIKSLSNCISSISSQADLECKHSNESHLKDSSESFLW